MDPVPYVDLLNQRYQLQGFPPYEWTVNDPVALTPLLSRSINAGYRYLPRAVLDA